MEGFGIFIVIVGAFALYFLPSIVGYSKRNASAIIVLNFFLGWTLIGWVVALVWASTADPPQPQIIHSTPPPSRPSQANKLDSLKKLKDLLDTGAITEMEYNKEKGKLLNE